MAMVMLMMIMITVTEDRVLYSPGWPGTYAADDGLKFLIHLPLPPKC